MKNTGNVQRVRFVQAASPHNPAIPSTSSEALNLDYVNEKHEEQGKNVQTFYTELVGSSAKTSKEQGSEVEIIEMKSADHGDDGIMVIHPSQSSPNLKTTQRQNQEFTERDIRLFLKAAAENDLETVRRHLDNGLNIEVHDIWNWTGLLCAAASGAEQVVMHLISKGANIDHQDYAGRTANELAQRCGHLETRRIIENYRRERDSHWLSESLQTKCELTRTYCDACQCYYTDDKSSQESHECSMLHMINTGLLPQEGYSYGISPRNPGYKLLKNYGWTEAKGLGKSGQGRKYPIKTILKRDKKGLGLNKAAHSKITHFGPMDKRAVEDSVRTNTKPIPPFLFKEMERQKEAEIRRMFDEYDE